MSWPGMPPGLPGLPPGFPQAQVNPLNPALMEALDQMLQNRFAQLESRLVEQIGTMCLPLPPPPTSDLKENLIRIEEKVTSFHNMFDQLDHLTKTTDSILSQVKAASEIKVEPRTPTNSTKPCGISINLLPPKTLQNNSNESPVSQPSSVSDLCKTSVDILGLVRAIDLKVASNVNKVSIIDAKLSSLQNRFKVDGVDPSELVSFNNGDNGDVSSSTVKESQSDLRQLIEEKLVPVQAVSDKLDMLIKQDKDLGVKILGEFLMVKKTLDETYNKASDAKSYCSDIFQNMETLTSTSSENSLKRQINLVETGTDKILKTIGRMDYDKVYTAVKSMKKSFEDFETKSKSSRERHGSRGTRRHSDRSRSSSNDVTVVSILSGSDKKKKKKTNDKKRSRSSSTSSNDNDGKKSPSVDLKLLNTMDKNVTKLLETVDDLETRIGSWIKSSKKSKLSSEETTNCLLQQMVNNNKTLESLLSQQKSVEEQVLDLSTKSESLVNLWPKQEETRDLVSSVDAKVQEFGAVLDALQKDQNGHFKNLSGDIMSINDKTERLSKLDDVLTRLSKLDDVLAKIKILYKQGSGYESNVVKILRDIEVSIIQVKEVTSSSSKASSDPDATLLVLKNLLPSMEEFNIKALPIMEDLKRLQRQAADQDELQEKQNCVNLQKILSHLEDIATKAAKPSDPRTLPTDTTLLQVFSAINDLKNMVGHRDQITQKLLADVKNDTGKAGVRISEILKTKASEKMLLKVEHSIEEMRKDSINDMKTLSTMNTTLQGIKLRSSASDSKFDLALKELKQLLTESKGKDPKVPQVVDEVVVEKFVEKFKACQDELKAVVTKNNEDTMRLVRRLHEEILETSDVKILESAIENQSALTAKSVVETLRGDGSFSRSTADCGSALAKFNSKDVEERIVREMEKISGISSEILNSVEDLKQLTSTVPNTVHDLVPKMEKLSADVTELPNEIGAYTAALEENLGKNVEKFIKEMYETVLQEILGKFDVMEQRMAVIKKYAKHGSNMRSGSTPTNLTRATDLEAATSETSSLPDTFIPDTVVAVVPDKQLVPAGTDELAMTRPSQPTMSTINEEFSQSLMRHVSNECRILGDSIAKTMDQFISTADTSEVKQNLLSHHVEMSRLFQELRLDQARGLVVEEQLEALKQTILQPINELKPAQEQLVNLVESELKKLLQDKRKTNQQEISNAQFEKLLTVQQNCFAQLTEIKRFYEFKQDDRLREVLGSNVESAVRALSRSKKEEKSKHQAHVVKSLIEFLKRIQATYQDILVNSDRSIEFQATLNDTLYKIIPVLELIHRALHDRKSQKLDSGSIPDLCNELGVKLVILTDLEQKLISDKQDRSNEDLSSLVQMCKNIMDQLNVGIEEMEGEEGSKDQSVQTMPLTPEIKDVPMDDPPLDEDSHLPAVFEATNHLPDEPTEKVQNKISDENIVNPTERILLELQEMTTSLLTLDGLDPAVQNSTLVVPTKLSVTKTIKGPNWGPKTKRVNPVSSATGVESNLADAGESVISNESDQSNDKDQSKKTAKNHIPTLAERKAFCPKLISSHIDEDGPLSKLVRRKSSNPEVIPFKCSKDSEPRRSPSVEKVSKCLSITDSEPISEDEAKKRKYQPQVVVEKIDKNSVRLSRVDGLSAKARFRDSSADSMESSGSKKLKKEK